ncbi:MAG: hypothetical protein ABIO45_07770 [Burkholderiaceae bacterium]
MIDRLFSAALAFTLLAGGTAAIGAAMFEGRPASRPAVHIVRLPTVEIVGQRVALTAAAAPVSVTQ